MKNVPIWIIDSHAGIYVGERLSDYIVANKQTCINFDALLTDIAICSGGPYGPHAEQYVESWIELESVQFKIDGTTWGVFPNEGDVWLVPEGFDPETFFE
jgi:hypothetical protein